MAKQDKTEAPDFNKGTDESVNETGVGSDLIHGEDYSRGTGLDEIGKLDDDENEMMDKAQKVGRG